LLGFKASNRAIFSTMDKLFQLFAQWMLRNTLWVFPVGR
jgi:hypothetical protein